MTPPSIPMPTRPRSPWQRFYGAVHRWRERRWAKRATRLPRPVISIGNLHWGGTGKTPLTLAVARHLRDRGLRVAVLSRGYKRQGSGIQLVSDGGDRETHLPPAQAGDEPALLAREAPGVAVVVGKHRDEAGRWALEHLDPPPEIFVLDDGFSHLRLARDLDLLVFPTHDPFAGGRLPPTGRLREPLAASARAHAALLTGDATRDKSSPEEAQALAEALRPLGFAGPGFAAPTRTGPPSTVDGEPLDSAARVLLVSAIARPERFSAAAIRAAEDLGFEIVAELRLRDHDPYVEATLDRIRSEIRRREATAVLTTGKDLVKLQGRLEVPGCVLAELPLHCEPEPAFFRWLDSRLEAMERSGWEPR